jgi:methionyl-tRNA formyltransferase
VRLVFFGTPDFAVPSLRALLGEGFDVVGVVTQPDRPRGRSRSRLVPPPVKVAAEQDGVPVLQPERPSHADFLEELRELTPDLGIVVAYGHILKPDLLAIPPRGLVNVHASLLPRFRGAAPIPWTILEGVETTGVTIMQLTEELDAGPILHQVETPVAPDETGGELAVRLAELGALALIECLALMEEGLVTPRAQNDRYATYARKIDRDACRIRWNADAMSVARGIRAFDPEPGAWTELDGRMVKLFGPTHRSDSGEPGTILTIAPRVVIAAEIGSVEIQEIQPDGRTRMPADAWARGRGAAPGQQFR